MAHTFEELMRLHDEATNLWFCVAQGESVRAQAKAADAAVETYARALVSDEREACAVVCEAGMDGTSRAYADSCKTCAEQIRMRPNVS